MADRTTEDALALLVGDLSAPGGNTRFQKFGYDLYLPDLVLHHVPLRNAGTTWASPEHAATSRPFYEAAWQLCRRGILRPGVREVGAQAVGDGEGFCLTEAGRAWLQKHGQDQVLPVMPRRFLQFLGKFSGRFWRGFADRATEALGCYEAGLALATCAMCGAAAESVLLALAIERASEGEDVVKMYAGRDGRRKTEEIVLRGQRDHVQRAFRGYMELLKYWRDEAAHGLPSHISDDEAFTSLMLIARLARFAADVFPDAEHQS